MRRPRGPSEAARVRAAKMQQDALQNLLNPDTAYSRRWMCARRDCQGLRSQHTIAKCIERIHTAGVAGSNPAALTISSRIEAVLARIAARVS